MSEAVAEVLLTTVESIVCAVVYSAGWGKSKFARNNCRSKFCVEGSTYREQQWQKGKKERLWHDLALAQEVEEWPSGPHTAHSSTPPGLVLRLVFPQSVYFFLSLKL